MLSCMAPSFWQLPQERNILTASMPTTAVAAILPHGKQIPLQEVPMLIGNPDSIRTSLHKLNGIAKLAFSYDGKVYPAQMGKPLELVPFFRLHNSRYAVYFRQTSEEQFKAIQEEMATAERKATELANQTVDLNLPW